MPPIAFHQTSKPSDYEMSWTVDKTCPSSRLLHGGDGGHDCRGRVSLGRGSSSGSTDRSGGGLLSDHDRGWSRRRSDEAAASGADAADRDSSREVRGDGYIALGGGRGSALSREVIGAVAVKEGESSSRSGVDVAAGDGVEEIAIVGRSVLDLETQAVGVGKAVLVAGDGVDAGVGGDQICVVPEGIEVAGDRGGW